MSSHPVSAARTIVVSGPTGSGKTTIATALAARHGWVFLEGDDFHPSANVDKMRGGQPLSDADRLPWLRAIRSGIDRHSARGESVVVACSALRRSYRDVLRDGPGGAFVVQLVTDEATLTDRVAAREGHFMPPTLVQSQVADLERLHADEEGVVVLTDHAADVVLQRVEEALRRIR